jgi:hypothetical protein
VNLPYRAKLPSRNLPGAQEPLHVHRMIAGQLHRLCCGDPALSHARHFTPTPYLGSAAPEVAMLPGDAIAGITAFNVAGSPGALRHK